jgi:hypothetical protein
MIRRRTLALAALAFALGCKKPPPVVETRATATATPPPAPTIPPFVAPAALPPGDVWLLGTDATLRIEPAGAMKRDAQNFVAIAQAGDGTVFASTWSALFRRNAKGWTKTLAYGDKTRSALIMAKHVELAMTGGGSVVNVLGDMLWAGRIEGAAIMVGADYKLSPRALDGRGQLWGGGLDDNKLYLANPTGGGTESMVVASWAPSSIVALAGRKTGGVYVLSHESLDVGGGEKETAKSFRLPLKVDKGTLAASANGTVVVRTDGSTLLFIGPDGGCKTLAQASGEVFAVDGRSRVWTYVGDELKVIGPDGKVFTQKVSATMPKTLVAILPIGGGADLK